MIVPKPQAVIFDMDGLILDTERIYRIAWQRATAELGYHMSDDLYLCFIGRRIVDCEALLLDIYGSHFPLSDFLGRGSQFYQEHIQSNGIPIKPGLDELLDFLEAKYIPKAIATSTNRTAALQCLGELSMRFETIVTGEEVSRGKPAPDIFLLAAERLQVSPEQCLVLEDADAGVEAAHTAGIPVIMVPDLKPPSASVIAQATCICASLQDIKNLLMNS